MAYDYQKTKKLYEQLNDQQKQQFAQDTSGNVQQFLKDYQKEAGNVYTPTTTQKTTNTYQNQGAGNYTYNPTSGYYEKSQGGYQNQGEGNYTYNQVSGYYENNSKPQTNQYTDYSKYNNNSNFYGQNNQYQGNASTINTLGNMATDIYNQGNKGYSDLMGGSNYADNFDDAVNNKLKSAFGLNNLNELKNKYPEQYESVVQALESVRGVRDATDPTQRQMLDGYLQGIIGSGVGAGSDMSKLNVLNQTLMDKFKNGEQVAEDMRNIVKLQTEGMSTSEIASKMGISEDQVQQAILAYNGLDNKLGEYYQLKSGVASDITEPYDKQLARLDEEKKIALERANRQVDWLKQDFDTSLERQKQQNDINAHNADAIAGRTGLAFSKRGIEGLNYVAEQARQIIDDITKNYDRNNQNLADGIADIIRKWQRNNEDLMKASQDALTAAKNNFTANMLTVQQQYGTVGLQAQQALANNVQGFIEQAQNIYDNALVRQQQNLTNLINNVSNINALEAQNLTMRNAKIQQFQNEALTMNRSQLQQLAKQLGMSSEEFGDLVSYQVQAVQNQLNGYVPGAGVMFQDEINSLLQGGANAQEVIQWVMNQPEFQAMSQSGGTDEWVRLNDNTLYNKKDGTFKSFDGTGVGTDYSGTGYESMGNYGSTTNYVSSQTVNGQSYGVSENTYYGLQDFMANHAVGTTGGQCGKFVNDYLQSLGLDRVFTDPIDKKVAAINTQEGYKPQVGDIVVMDSPTSRKYGHVAIVTAVDGDKITTLESNKKGEGEVFSRTIDTSKQNRLGGQIYGYYHPDGNTTNVSNGTMGTGVGGNMSDYDINTAVMKIGRQAYGANISNAESERVEKVIKDGTNMGKNQTEILYDILGMKITNNKDKAEPFIDIMVQNSDKDGLSAYNTEGFANFINKGKYVEAMNLVEQAVAKERGNNYAADLSKYENGSKYAYTKGDEMIKAIEDQTNKLGIVAGRVTDNWSKVMGDKDFQKLKSSIVNYIADWRHEMLGSATTETELKMINDLIPSITDNPANTITKIKEFQDYWLNKYNQTRGNLYLPSVTKNTVLDKDNRVQLYFGNNGATNNVSAIQFLSNNLNGINRTNTSGVQGRIGGNIQAGGTMQSGKKL